MKIVEIDATLPVDEVSKIIASELKKYEINL